LEGTTKFIQGNGERRSNQTVFIMWLPFNVQAEIIKKSDRAFEILIENLDEDDLSIKWSINPSLPPEALLNSDNRKQFVIDPEYLIEGTTYEVSSELTYIP